MKKISKIPVQFLLALALLAAPLVAFQLQGTNALAQSSYFSGRGCTDCHSAPTASTCAGCHEHSGSLTATKNKTTSYAPGETVTITLTSSGARSGWVGVRLYDQTGAEIARSTGNQSGMGGSTTFGTASALSAPAPATAGTYTWRVAYLGNENGDGSGDVHSEISVNVPITVASVAPPADTAAPVVTFTLPAAATSLTVPVSSLSATDNVAVTGYLINKVATPPAASAAGWTATAPTSVTAVAGSNTFYAWAKDAAGNVSAVKSATVVVSLPDTAAPVVTFALPAAATSLTVSVSSLSATDNVAVTGYLVNKVATPPAASAAGWTAAAPTSVTAVAGSNTFYAWAKDAAGNVSLAKSANVTVTLADTAAPVVSFTLPATATSLTVPVSGLSATDNVAVTGYLINKVATPPAASAAGWTAAAPASVTAVAGSNTFYAWAKDAAGNVSAVKSATVVVTIAPAADTTKPALTISSLANGSLTNKVTLNVSGNASDEGGIKSVTVNNQAVTVNPDGTFSYALTLTAGANTITTIATDNAGNQQTDTRTVTYDLNAPVLAVSAPADNSTTTQSFIAVTGTISETSQVSVSVNNGSPQSAAISGSGFSATINLVSGVNTVDIIATDLAGNTTSAKRTVTYDNSNSTFTLAVTNPAQDITTRSSSLTLKGTVVDASGKVKVRISMNGKTYSPKVDNGVFKQRLTFTKAKLYAITVSATDETGSSSTVNRNVIYRPANKYKHNDDDDDDNDDDDDDDDD